MASTASSSHFPSLNRRISSPAPISTRCHTLRPISVSSEGHSETKEARTTLPIRKIPGGYGLPLIGPLRDRMDYFYDQGRDDFFKSRIRKYQSTVFRSNMPPGPFLAADPRVVVLLDGKSFPVLFDTTKVEKKDVFTGTFTPSTDFTGGHRVLSFLDPSELNHAKLKKLVFHLLKTRSRNVVPEFRSSFGDLFRTLEHEISSKGRANFGNANDQAAFNFLAGALYCTKPAETELGLDGPKLVAKWVLFQLCPILTLGLPKPIEEFSIHSFPLPPCLVKEDYQKLYDFFLTASSEVLDEAETIGIPREEACHNLLYVTCFNAFGGLKFFFPSMLKWISRGGMKLHTQLAKEIRSVVKSHHGEVTMDGIEQMELMKSTVYECLRIEPPVPLQYGRAKRDLIVESHEAAFEVKKGEMMFGYQPFATKDPRIFERAEEFEADRFVGEGGQRLLRHVLWSNGPETETPNLGNKQCPGKDFVVLVSRLMLVELFLRYDSFDMEVVGTSPLTNSATITSLKTATF